MEFLALLFPVNLPNPLSVFLTFDSVFAIISFKVLEFTFTFEFEGEVKPCLSLSFKGVHESK